MICLAYHTGVSMKTYSNKSLSRVCSSSKLKSYKKGGVVEGDNSEEDSGPQTVSVSGGSIPSGTSGPGNVSRVSGVAGGGTVNVPVGDYNIGVGVDYSKVRLQTPSGNKTIKRGGVNEVSISRDLGNDSEVSLTYGRQKDEGKASHSLSIGYSRKF